MLDVEKLGYLKKLFSKYVVKLNNFEVCFLETEFQKRTRINICFKLELKLFGIQAACYVVLSVESLLTRTPNSFNLKNSNFFWRPI